MKEIFYNQTGGRLILSENEKSLRKLFFAGNEDKHAYTIAWNIGGEQQVEIDNVEYRFPANTVLPLMLNQSFSFEHADQVVAWQFNREFYCIVDHDIEVGCVGFIFYGAITPMFIQIGEKDLGSLKNLLEVFRDEFQTVDMVQGNMLRMLLVRLIIKITRLARIHYLPEAQVDHGKFELIRKFQLLVELHFRKEHQVQFYASAMNKSPKTLSNLFRKCYDKSPSELIQRRITDEASRLLIYTKKSSKEIASELGFSDAAHFSRFYKSATSSSPTEFRKKPGNPN